MLQWKYFLLVSVILKLRISQQWLTHTHSGNPWRTNNLGITMLSVKLSFLSPRAVYRGSFLKQFILEDYKSTIKCFFGMRSFSYIDITSRRYVLEERQLKTKRNSFWNWRMVSLGKMKFKYTHLNGNSTKEKHLW